MSRITAHLSRTRWRLLGALALVAVALGATYAAAGRGRSSGESHGRKIIVIHHATPVPPTMPAETGAGTTDDAIANVLDADVKIGEYHSDYLSYAGISAEALGAYSSSFDPSQVTVVATAHGTNFYVCSRSGKWYAEQHGLRTPIQPTLTPSPLCKL